MEVLTLNELVMLIAAYRGTPYHEQRGAVNHKALNRLIDMGLLDEEMTITDDGEARVQAALG